MTETPFEPDDGQDPDRPNVGLALLVVVLLLGDLRDYLMTHHHRGPLRQAIHREDPHDDLLLRIATVLVILDRVREDLPHGRDH